MKKILIILGLALSAACYSQTAEIENNESGASARAKINETIVKANDHADTIPVLRTDINNNVDSLDLLRTDVNTSKATTTDHAEDISANTDSVTDIRTDVNTNTATGVTNGTNISSNSISISTNASGISDNTDTATAQRVDINNKGDVHTSGTPVVDQLAIWTDGSTIKGDALIGVNSVGILTNQVNEMSYQNGVFIEGVEFIDGVIEMVHGLTRTPVSTRGVIWSSSADKLLYYTTDTETFDLTGGGVSSDTTDALRVDINALINDTISFSEELHSFPFGIGAGLTGDDAIMLDDAYLGGWRVSGDTVVCDSLYVWVEGNSGDVEVCLYYGPPNTARSAGTAVIAPQTVSVAGEMETVTSFNYEIAPGNRLWMEISDVTTGPLLILCDLIYHKK